MGKARFDTFIADEDDYTQIGARSYDELLVRLDQWSTDRELNFHTVEYDAWNGVCVPARRRCRRHRHRHRHRRCLPATGRRGKRARSDPPVARTVILRSFHRLIRCAMCAAARRPSARPPTAARPARSIQVTNPCNMGALPRRGRIERTASGERTYADVTGTDGFLRAQGRIDRAARLFPWAMAHDKTNDGLFPIYGHSCLLSREARRKPVRARAEPPSRARDRMTRPALSRATGRQAPHRHDMGVQVQRGRLVAGAGPQALPPGTARSPRTRLL
jgi:hypothetical protein